MPYKNKEDQKACSDAWYQRNKEKHRETAKRTRIKHLSRWKLFKSKVACAHCGFSHPAAIDFHHVVRDETHRAINFLIRRGQFAAAYDELKKCILLCANCHRILHYNENKSVQS